MYEGSLTPGAHRPKPLTEKQLEELREKLKLASKRIKTVQRLEAQERKLEAQERKKKGIDSPKWV